MPLNTTSCAKSGALEDLAAFSPRPLTGTEDCWKLRPGASADRYCCSKLDLTGDVSDGSPKAFDVEFNDEAFAICSSKFGPKDRGESGETGVHDLMILPDSGPLADAARLISPYVSGRLDPSMPVFGPLG